MTRKESAITAYLLGTIGMFLLSWYFLKYAPCTLCYVTVGVSWMIHMRAGFQIRQNGGFDPPAQPNSAPDELTTVDSLAAAVSCFEAEQQDRKKKT